MDTKTAEAVLNELKQQLAEINEDNRDEHKLDAFRRRAEMLIKQIFGSILILGRPRALGLCRNV